MNINLTLLVQIINFFIAYIIIEKLLFKPASVLVTHEEHELLRLEQTLNKQYQIISELEQQKQKNWAQARHSFAATLKLIIPKKQVPYSLKLPSVHFNYKIEPQEVAALENALMARILYA